MQFWSTLETTFSHRSKSRELRLKDELQHIKKDAKTIVEYSHEFKSVCDQLAAMGRPVDDLDKIHWYLRGLGSSFSTFSTTQLSLSSLPSFTEIVPMAESYENFVKSLELPSTGSTSAAFTASCSNKSASARGGGHASRGSRSRGGSRYQRNRPIRCQICRGEGHYATSCRDRYSHSSNIANIMEAFTSCTLNDNQDSDWYTDTGATAHMTNDATQLDKSNTYTGKDRVIVGNGASFPISHTDTISPTSSLTLKDVLVVPGLTKNLISISKLTSDFPFSITFTNDRFIIQNQVTRRVVATGQRENGLYVLERGHQSLISVLSNNCPQASFDAPDAEPTIPSVHEPSHASTLMPADPNPVTTEFSSLLTDPICAPFLTPTCSTLFSPCASPKASSPAAKHPGRIVAMDEEIQALHKNHTWDLGFTQQPGLDFTDTFSTVVKASTVRVVLSLAVSNNWPLWQLDVKNAFLNGLLQEEVYMDQPSGYVDSKYLTHVCRLRQALYGLKQAPRAWFHRFSSFLLAIGFICSRADSSLFVLSKGADLIYLLLYVDDVVVTGSNLALLDGFIGKLTCEFATKDLGSLNYFLGLEAHRSSTSLFLSQAKYAHEILQRAQLVDSKPVGTPMVVAQHLSTAGPDFDDPSLYRSLVGALQYLTITHPNYCSRHKCWTLRFGLSFTPSSSRELLAYSNADWAECPNTRRSISGYAVYFGGNLVSWSSKKQPTVSQSSCESEYQALALTAAEVKWLRHLLRDLHVSPSSPPVILCDNQSSIFLAVNPVSHKRSKHIDLDYHFVRELVASEELKIRYVPTHLQIADMFTKSLGRPAFIFVLFQASHL
uniref:Uncharacterized protein n=1 Tax=Fagus sylvatica TaxID=28930 RepID=A0A2N9G1B4_FAGSY